MSSREVSKKELVALMFCKASYSQHPWDEYLPDQWSKYKGTGSPSLHYYVVEEKVPEVSKYTAEGGLMKVVVGKLQTENTLLLAFRGTYSLQDAATDLHQRPSAWKDIEPLLRPEFCWQDIRFHSGFLNRCKGKPGIPGFPRRFLVDFIRGGGKVVISGHSMGGAVAAILALGVLADLGRDKAVAAFPEDCVQCITFGAPSFCLNPLHDKLTQPQLLRVFTHFMHESDPVPSMYTAVKCGLAESWIQDLFKVVNIDEYLLPMHSTPGGYVFLSEHMKTDVDFKCPSFFTEGSGSWLQEKGRRLREKIVCCKVFAPHFLYTYAPLVFRHVYTQAVRSHPNLARHQSLYGFLTASA